MLTTIPLNFTMGGTGECCLPLFIESMSMLVCGPSKAGKTEFVMKFVCNVKELMAVHPIVIIWCYTEFQPSYTKLQECMPEIQFSEGLPDMELLKKDKARPKLIIFDDMMSVFEKNPALETLFVKGCHHWNLSCIHIVQNLYCKGIRTARINANYLVLFKNPSDKLQVANLARQLYPRHVRFFIDAYENATVHPHTYILLDVSQACPDNLRLRTNIFPDEDVHIFIEN